MRYQGARAKKTEMAAGRTVMCVSTAGPTSPSTLSVSVCVNVCVCVCVCTQINIHTYICTYVCKTYVSPHRGRGVVCERKWRQAVTDRQTDRDGKREREREREREVMCERERKWRQRQ